MKNILATSDLRRRLASINLIAVVLGVGMIGQVLWGVWTTDKLLALEKREVVTVQLSRIMGDFIEAEARAGRPPEETKMRVQAYLKAVEASVQQLGREGRTVLVAEAVVAGSTPDLTQSVRADVVRRMGAIPDAAR
ncbi:type-F conjugative transfer system protein TrbI [Novosphingobium olei]|uniref:type-F conjugative transfer system protein TrbI n=1 Tax=Novosphingobium olei TaxID=2728851 RepID=UPI00308512ED|nr:type-F conjugative transfer system protein TrbI [Novosphingobium olei]